MFPKGLNTIVENYNRNIGRKIALRDGLTVLIVTNGSGKTHLIKGIKNAIRISSLICISFQVKALIQW